MLLLLLSGYIKPIEFIALTVGLLLGITVHEYAHAWVAYRNGDPTAQMDGRLSLNPLAHLDPLGTLMLLLAGFGWGKPVPINPSYFKHRSDELKVAIAGITANIIIAFILGIPVRIALLNGNLPDSIVFLHFLNGMIYANLLLAAFNLIPIFPLDGSHFIEYFLDDYGRMVFQQYGPFLLLFLLIADRLGSFSIISTIIEPIIRVFSLIATGTWSVFIK